MAAGLPLALLNGHPYVKWLVYPLLGLIGVGYSIMINVATCLISDSIKKNDTNAAFVYGFYSFIEKVTNGIFAFILSTYFLENQFVLRVSFAFIPIICAIIAFLFTLYGKKHLRKKPTVDYSLYSPKTPESFGE